MNAFRSELLKVGTIRTLAWLAVAEVGLVLIAAVSVAASSGPLESAADHRSVARIAAVSLVFALIAGIIVMAGESTHGTITQTLLAAPVRERVVAAKVIVAAAIGLALAVLAELLAIVIGAPGGVLHVSDTQLVFVGTLIGAALAGMVGVGVGTVFRGQGSAIAVSLLWLLIGESVLAAAVRHGVRFFPGHAFAATVTGTRAGSEDVLGTWPAVVVAVGYAVVSVAVGTALLSRRDV